MEPSGYVASCVDKCVPFEFGFNLQLYTCLCEAKLPTGDIVEFRIDIITDGVIKPLEHRSWVYDMVERYLVTKHIKCIEILELHGIDKLSNKSNIPNYGTMILKLHDKLHFFM